MCKSDLVPLFKDHYLWGYVLSNSTQKGNMDKILV